MFWWALLGIIFAASSAVEAEVQRLREVMEKRYRKELWEAVDASYLDMIEIDKKEDFITNDDHLKGAMAANSLGNINETLRRLERSDSDQAKTWKQSILQTTGKIELRVNKDYVLVSMDTFPAFEVRKCLDFANQQLKENGEFIGRVPTGAYQYGPLQLIVREEETIPIESEILDAPSRKEMKKEKEKSKENLKKKLNQKFTPNKSKVRRADNKEKTGNAIGVETLVGKFVVPVPTNEEKVSYLNFGGQVGWERAWDVGFFQVGVNPQVSFGGLSGNSFVGFSPILFVGGEVESSFFRLGLVPQLMKINIPTIEFPIENGTMIQTIEGGTTFGWGGEAQLGMKLNDDLALNFRTRLSTDMTMYYIIPSLGVKYYY